MPADHAHKHQFHNKAYFYTLLEQDVPLECIHLEFELNFALGHEQFKLILKFPVCCTWLQKVPENFRAVHVIILM